MPILFVLTKCMKISMDFPSNARSATYKNKTEPFQMHILHF